MSSPSDHNTTLDPDDLEAQMLAIGQASSSQPMAHSSGPSNRRPTKSSGRGRGRSGSRGPGRPRKEPVQAMPQAMPQAPPSVTFEDDDADDVPRVEEAQSLVPSEVPTEEVVDSLEARLAAIEKIKSMRLRFGGTGTGLQPDPQRHSIKVLQAELDVLNQQVDCRRGEKTIRLVTVTFIAPVISMLADAFGKSVEATGKPRPFDLDGLSDVVSSEWDVLFSEAAAQIAINNPSFFSTSPVVQYGEGMLGACFQTAMINKQKKAQAQTQQAS